MVQFENNFQFKYLPGQHNLMETKYQTDITHIKEIHDFYSYLIFVRDCSHFKDKIHYNPQWFKTLLKKGSNFLTENQLLYC